MYSRLRVTSPKVYHISGCVRIDKRPQGCLGAWGARIRVTRTHSVGGYVWLAVSRTPLQGTRYFFVLCLFCLFLYLLRFPSKIDNASNLR